MLLAWLRVRCFTLNTLQPTVYTVEIVHINAILCFTFMATHEECPCAVAVVIVCLDGWVQAFTASVYH